MVRGARELDVALLDLRAFPRRQQLVQRVKAFVGANPRSLFVPDTDAKHVRRKTRPVTLQVAVPPRWAGHSLNPDNAGVL